MAPGSENTLRHVSAMYNEKHTAMCNEKYTAMYNEK